MTAPFLQSSAGAGRAVASRLEPVTFRGPAGHLEGLWKEAEGARRGSAVFAHPHPRHGGTLHNKVVFRAARALTRNGFATLRFNFRGVGLSEGRYDDGRGEVQDFRGALDEAARRGGVPIVAGGFSFGSAAALRGAEGDSRVAALLAIGLPLATESGQGLAPPSLPSLFVTGESDVFGPPKLVSDFLGPGGNLRVVAGADHFFEGKLDELEAILTDFLGGLDVTGSAA